VDRAVGDAEPLQLRPAEHVFQARSDTTPEVEYAPRTGFRDSDSHEIVHEVKGLFAALNAFTPDRSMNDALSAALAVRNEARGVLVVVASYVGTFEFHSIIAQSRLRLADGDCVARPAWWREVRAARRRNVSTRRI
jgi:hypothetical protein